MISFKLDDMTHFQTIAEFSTSLPALASFPLTSIFLQKLLLFSIQVNTTYFFILERNTTKILLPWMIISRERRPAMNTINKCVFRLL